MFTSSARAPPVSNQYLGWTGTGVQVTRPGVGTGGHWHLFHHWIVPQRSNPCIDWKQTIWGEDGRSDGTGVPRGTNRIRKQEGGYPHYPWSSIESGPTYHHASCRVAGTARGHKGPTHAGLRMHESLTVWLGNSSNNKYEKAAHKVQRS